MKVLFPKELPVAAWLCLGYHGSHVAAPNIRLKQANSHYYHLQSKGWNELDVEASANPFSVN